MAKFTAGPRGDQVETVVMVPALWLVARMSEWTAALGRTMLIILPLSLLTRARGTPVQRFLDQVATSTIVPILILMGTPIVIGAISNHLELP